MSTAWIVINTVQSSCSVTNVAMCLRRDSLSSTCFVCPCFGFAGARSLQIPSVQKFCSKE